MDVAAQRAESRRDVYMIRQGVVLEGGRLKEKERRC